MQAVLVQYDLIDTALQLLYRLYFPLSGKNLFPKASVAFNDETSFSREGKLNNAGITTK